MFQPLAMRDSIHKSSFAIMRDVNYFPQTECRNYRQNVQPKCAISVAESKDIIPIEADFELIEINYSCVRRFRLDT